MYISLFWKEAKVWCSGGRGPTPMSTEQVAFSAKNNFKIKIKISLLKNKQYLTTLLFPRKSVENKNSISKRINKN